MGSRLFSNTTSLLGGRDFASASDRAEVASVLGVPVANIPTAASLPYDGILEAVLSGRIRALWVIGTNGAHSWINGSDFRAIAEKLDFLVVQDLYADTETAALADLVLPAAGWGEKHGCFVNSERRIGAVHKVRQAPGEALADFAIFQAIARYWGCDDLADAWATPAQAFQLLKRLSRGTPCDFGGIEDHAMLAREGGVQWPHVEGADAPASERRLFEDGRFLHEDGRARFIFGDDRPVPEPTNARYPLTLLTGRGSAAQWHTQTRTKRSPVLAGLAPTVAYAEINPADARQRGIGPTDDVVIRSRRGRVVVRAFLTRTVPPGCIFIPMHYPEANKLTFPAFDPESRQPAYKACAVEVASRKSWEG
jgi:assimilatory nitrate reductase catalytic subunit